MDRDTVIRGALRLGLTLLALVLISTFLRNIGLYEVTRQESEGLNTFIVLVGSIYAVILAFAIFVIWGQFTDVEHSVMRECIALNDMLRFSDYIHPEAGSAIRRAVADYVQEVLKYEWQALGVGRRDKRADSLFSDVMTAVMAASQANPALVEHPLYLQLIDIARSAGERRAERVTKSLTRIPPTMFWFVNSIAGGLMLLILSYPFQHSVTGAACLVVVATILMLANFVLRDLDNPLQGAWNVSPKPFSELPV